MIRTLTIILTILMAGSINAQEFYNMDSIQTINITFTQSNWDQLLDNAYASTGDYIMAESVEINGELFDSVGVKYKGNSTYQANQTKNPFHIELDTYKDQDYQGYKDIKLANGAKDPSFLREVLSYQILRQYMDAPLSNYANVYVNGNLLGLYTNSESITKTFVNNRFGSKGNTFIKCNPPDGAGPGTNDLPNLVYLGQDSSNYYDAYEMKSDEGWQELINLCDTLTNNIADIEKMLDVDRALWMLAFDNVLVNLDSYIGGFAQNYYLYRDDNKRFIPIVWDLNESFGQFAMTGSGHLNSTSQKQQMSHLLNLNDSDYPLVQKLLSIPMYKRMYLAHFKTILLENFDNNSYNTTAQSLHATIDAAVLADGNKLYSYNNFLSNITSDVNTGGGPGGGTSPGITNLMNGRNNYLLGLSDFTQTEPTISIVTLSDTIPVISQTITVAATVTDANTVYLGYRNNVNTPFVRTEMFDDGAHNDGAANDGVYGVDMDVTNYFMQYYIYAENSGIGMFSPQRAEHEYHTVNATFGSAGDLVINEFLASNDANTADQDGEFDDWIELYNNSASAINLEGYYLSDNESDMMKWTFPAGSEISADGYLIIWADNDETQAGLHSNFKLSSAGESIYLSDASGTIIDQIAFTSQTTDLSFARIPNGTGNFQSATPTFNTNNESVAQVEFISAEQVEIKVSPNPATNSFLLEIGQITSPQSEVIIYDLRGIIVYHEMVFENQTVDCSAWAPGMYIVRVGESYRKIIKH